MRPRPHKACVLLLGLLGLGVPAPGRAASPLPGYEIIPLGRGHNNRLCLAATIGGIKGLMMLDTGANGTALSNATYRSLLLDRGRGSAEDLPPEDATTSRSLVVDGSHAPAGKGLPRTTTINGVTTPYVMAQNFQVGKSNLGNVPVCLIPRHFLYDQSPFASGDRLYDGLMGEDVLRRGNAIVDCGRLVLYLNTDPAKKLNLAAAFAREGWTRVPMTDIGNDFTVPCVLNGHAFRLIVDTGAPFTNLDRNLLAGAHIDSRDLPLHGGLIGTHAAQAGLARLSSLQIGSFTANNVHVTTLPQSFAKFGGPHDPLIGGPIVGLLGGDALASNSAVVDVGSKALYLKAPGGKAVRKT